MITFLDGPAAGQHFHLQRAPTFLRVVELGGKWDALDQLEDEPEPMERLLAYVLTHRPGWMHIRAPRSPMNGFHISAQYRFVQPQPPDEVMRRTEQWRAWANGQPRPETLITK